MAATTDRRNLQGAEFRIRFLRRTDDPPMLFSAPAVLTSIWGRPGEAGGQSPWARRARRGSAKATTTWLGPPKPADCTMMRVEPGPPSPPCGFGVEGLKDGSLHRRDGNMSTGLTVASRPPNWPYPARRPLRRATRVVVDRFAPASRSTRT